MIESLWLDSADTAWWRRHSLAGTRSVPLVGSRFENLTVPAFTIFTGRSTGKLTDVLPVALTTWKTRFLGYYQRLAILLEKKDLERCQRTNRDLLYIYWMKKMLHPFLTCLGIPLNSTWDNEVHRMSGSPPLLPNFVSIERQTNKQTEGQWEVVISHWSQRRVVLLYRKHQ